MAAQWVGYALEGVDYLSQLLGFLPLPTGIAGPISLAAPAAAAVQFAWKVLRESGREHRKRVLRERIVGLREFIDSLSVDQPSPDEARASRDARTEWATAIGQLAVLVPRTMHVVQSAVTRHWLRQALLLYSPTPGAVWALHAVFYFCVMQVAAMVLVLLVQVVSGDWALVAELAPTVGLFGVPLLVSWGLAADLDRAAARPRNALQRLLLSYVPDHRWRWVWHVLFYVSLAASMSLLALVGDALDGDTTGLLVGGGVWLVLLVLSRAMAVRNPVSRSWWERWMLAYSAEAALGVASAHGFLGVPVRSSNRGGRGGDYGGWRGRGRAFGSAAGMRRGDARCHFMGPGHRRRTRTRRAADWRSEVVPSVRAGATCSVDYACAVLLLRDDRPRRSSWNRGR